VEERGEAAVRVAAAKVRAIDVSLEVTSRYALFLFLFFVTVTDFSFS
jgi:hypothetical protein